jgi:DNA-directed RNA polymerase subunit RPC12/RpoP
MAGDILDEKQPTNLKCSKCGKTLPVEMFHKDKTMRFNFGFKYQCKDCAKQYWQTQKERIKAKYKYRKSRYENYIMK